MNNKEQQIEEMAKEIARILFEDCLLNIDGSCADCEWNGKDTKEYDCQSLLVAKKLLEKYQPKITEGSVVLSMEEIGELKCQVEEDCNKSYDLGSKQTAEKIFKMLYRRIDCYDEPCSYKLREELRIGKDYFQELAKQFGVEIKEEE